MSFIIHNGDCLDVLRSMPDASVDAVVTDPPYGLSFMGKKWDYDVPAVEVWAECLRVLKPGGHLLAFAGTRTQHRMAVRIEDAGFDIRDMIAWVYGSGFPKSLDVSKAIDKAAGAEREVLGHRVYGDGHVQNSTKLAPPIGTLQRTQDERTETAPATDAARQWQGWGTALKPALEPITVARKPLQGTVAANVLAHGTGGLNVDGCRVACIGGSPAASRRETSRRTGVVSTRPGEYGRPLQDRTSPERYKEERLGESTGRWPANLIHDGSEEVVGLFPEGAYGDSGNASRFFYCAKASKRDRDDGLESMPLVRVKMNNVNDADGDPVSDRFTKMARNSHPTVKPTDLMRYLCRLVTPPGGIVLDPFAGSGSTGKAAIIDGFRFIGIEREAHYVEIARARIDHAGRERAKPRQRDLIELEGGE